MPRKAERVRVEPGLYRAGKTYIACATEPVTRRPRWRALGEVGLMQARKLRDEFRVEVRNGGVPKKPTRATLADICDAYREHIAYLLEIGEIAPRTFDKYDSDTRLHVAASSLGPRPIASIGPDDLIAWHRAQRASGASSWSILARWAQLRAVLAYAVRHDLIPASPVAKLTSRELPKPGEGRKRILSREEMIALLENAPPRYLASIALALFTGVRESELLGLLWGEVDFAEGEIHVSYQMSRGKKGRPSERVKLKTRAAIRDVVMMPALAKILQKHRMTSSHPADDDLVLSTENGTTIGHRNLAQRGLNKAAEAAGLTGVTFHALRHTFASMLIAQGRDVVFVSRQLGHANPAITLRIYAHEFQAARHARQAREDLERDYGDLLQGLDHGGDGSALDSAA